MYNEKMSAPVIAVLILFVNFAHASGSNEVSLENVMKQILNISPPEVPVGKFHEEQQPPKHMLELYHRFTSGKRASGETVRSITPTTANVTSQNSNSNSVLFNITALPGAEEVRLAQLMLRRRRLARHPHPLHRKLLAPPCRVRLYQLLSVPGGRLRTVPLASIPVPQVTRGGWHSLDITSAVRELLLSSPKNSGYHTLGVRFEAPKSKIILPSHFLDQKDNASAFLMLFSEESSDNNVNPNTKKQPSISKEHIEVIALHVKNTDQEKKRHHSHHNNREAKNPRRHKNKGNHEEDEPDIQELMNMNMIQQIRKPKKFDEEFHLKYNIDKESEIEKNKISSNLIEELLENSESRRVIRSVHSPENRNHKRRSIYDNELPYEKLHIKDTSTSLTTTDQPEVVTDFSPVEEEDDKNLIPYPPGMERKKKRKWRRSKKRNHKSRTTKIPDEWNQEDRERHHRLHGLNSENSSSNQTCSRRQLMVSFKDLGWSNWIIEPKVFNAHYCAGSCNFPVPQNVPVTNHAIIQSLVHGRGFHNGIPAPCCVPHSMSPLTILYLGDDNHVILKNYRSMTVKTCGCR